MHGYIAYCMKHGHEWSGRWELNEDGILVVECRRCGARQVRI